MTTLAYFSANNRRPLAAQLDELEHYAEHAHIIAVTELRQRVKLQGFMTVQRREGHAGEALFVRDTLPVADIGLVRCAQWKRGVQIRDRHFPWVDVEIPGVDLIRVVGVHMPRRQFGDQRVLGPTYARRLRRRVLDPSPHPWLAIGDWNNPDANPFGLTREYRADLRPYPRQGTRIDKALIHPELRPFVKQVRAVMRPWHAEHDQHPGIWLELGAPPQRCGSGVVPPPRFVA